MSDHVEGFVAKISEKDTKNGGTIYNVCIEADGQDDEWFGHGFDTPIFQEGDEIEFDIEYNGEYANIDKGSVNILSEGEPKPKKRNNNRSGGRSGGSGSGRSGGRSGGRNSNPAARRNSGGSTRKPARSSGGSKGGGGDKPATMSKEEWACKDKIIRRQACMNTAILLIKGAIELEIVSLPTKKADKLDAYIALCDEEAIRLYDQYEEQVYGGGNKKRGRNNSQDDYDDDIPE